MFPAEMPLETIREYEKVNVCRLVLMGLRLLEVVMGTIAEVDY
jgi:hypothetical protein